MNAVSLQCHAHIPEPAVATLVTRVSRLFYDKNIIDGQALLRKWAYDISSSRSPARRSSRQHQFRQT